MFGSFGTMFAGFMQRLAMRILMRLVIAAIFLAGLAIYNTFKKPQSTPAPASVPGSMRNVSHTR